MIDWKWFGYPGHFINADRCRFRMCTQINNYLISTVGEMQGDNGDIATLGFNRTYETMVFAISGYCECGCEMPTHDGDCIDMQPYNNPKEAREGHIEMCKKWEASHD